MFLNEWIGVWCDEWVVSSFPCGIYPWVAVNVVYFSSDGGMTTSPFFDRSLLKDIGRILVEIFPIDLLKIYEATRVIY